MRPFDISEQDAFEQLRMRPWQTSVISAEDLKRQIESSIRDYGEWRIETEFRMGSGPTLSIKEKSVQSTTSFTVTAVWGAAITAEVATIGSAVRLACISADVLYEMVERMGSHFVWPLDGDE
jgi:hypothetical protein